MDPTDHRDGKYSEVTANPCGNVPPALIEIRNISKKFADFYANRNISLDIREGEIHAVVGENGAGKSTLMNLLFGRIRPDSGLIRLRGNSVFFKTPRDAIRARIGMVHQNILFFPQLSVLENIIVGSETEGGYNAKSILHAALLGTARARKKLRHLQAPLGFCLDLDQAANELPFAQRQQIELLRILYRGADVLILDEPTSLLSPQETGRLLEMLESLRVGGCTIVFISHRLGEVFSIADRITVLRHGSVAATLDARETDSERIARLMVGSVEEEEPKSISRVAQERAGRLGPAVDPGGVALVSPIERGGGEDFLEVRSLSVGPSGAEPAIDDLSISINQGEIFGIGGVVGNGQRSFALSLAGKVKPIGGAILLGGVDISSMDIAKRLDRGLRWLPENPAEEALLPDRPLWENLLLGRQRERGFATGGILRRRAILQYTTGQVLANNIAARDAFEPLAGLSGGNRQRVALARVLAGSPRLVVIEQPSRGLDLHASGRLYERLHELSREKRVTFVVLSYDLDELICLCDRIAVFYRGKISGTIERDGFSREQLARLMADVV